MIYYLLIICIFILFLLIIISIVWRLGSRRCSLPCPVWMKWMLDPPFTKGISSRTQKTIDKLDLIPGLNILDAGCGPGRLSIPIAEQIAPLGLVTAMDLQQGMLDEVRNRTEKKKITNIRYLNGGIGEGKLEQNYYDRIVMITVLGEIPDREKAMKEIFSALKSGGILLIEETIRDPHFQKVNDVRNYAKNEGFKEKEFFGSRFNYIILFEKP